MRTRVIPAEELSTRDELLVEGARRGRPVCEVVKDDQVVVVRVRAGAELERWSFARSDPVRVRWRDDVPARVEPMTLWGGDV